jgi:cell division transport system permease protein
MFGEFLSFWARETLGNVRRNPLMSALAISTVTVGLFILGGFYLTLGNLRSVVSNETQKLDMAVLLERDVSDERRDQLFRAAKIPQVKEVKLVSREQFLAEVREDIKRKKIQNVPLDDFDTPEDNPFWDELRIKLNNPGQDFFTVRDYFNSLKGKGVFEVRQEQDEAVRAIVGLNRVLFWSGLLASGVMGLAILLIIHNAIRLTIYARRREIRIMELVGATPGFIRVPFLLEGLLYGAAGAFLAALFLSPLYAAATRALQPWTQGLLRLGEPGLLVSCIGWMLVAGLTFGFLGSWASVARNAADTRQQ